MTKEQRSLFDTIAAFDIDGGPAQLNFCRRLSRENGWSETFSSRVINEYKRFIFLSMVAGHTVTPSDEVDQAWHLHMVYTDSYWNRLCGEVLPRPLHHGPTRGGKAENEKFEELYVRTLQSYRAWFDSEPPTDIWPSLEERFRRAVQFERVNKAENWVVPKMKFRRAALMTGVASVSIAGIAGCQSLVAQAGGPPFPIGLILGILGVFLVLLIVVSVITHLSGGQRKNGSGCSSGGCGGTGGCSSSSSDSGVDSGGGSGCSSGCGGGGCGGD